MSGTVGCGDFFDRLQNGLSELLRDSSGHPRLTKINVRLPPLYMMWVIVFHL